MSDDQAPDDDEAALLERHDESDEYQEQDYGGEPTHPPTPAQNETEREDDS